MGDKHDQRKGAEHPATGTLPRAPQSSDQDVPGLLKYADFDYGAFLRRRNVRVLMTTIIIIGTILFGYWLRSIFVPLLTALMFAYILNPIVVWFEKRGLSRAKAVSVVFFSFFLLIGAVLFVTIPAAMSNLQKFGGELQTYPAKLEAAVKHGAEWVNTYLPENMRIDARGFSLEFLKDYFVHSDPDAAAQGTGAGRPDATAPLSPSEINAASKNVFEHATAAAGQVLSWLLFLALVPFYTFYFMLGLNKLWERAKSYLPGKHRERIIGILAEIHGMMSAFFRGRLAICFIVSILCIALFMAFGVPFAVLLGFLGGFGVIIPFFPMIASLGPALLLMAVGDQHSGAEIGLVAAIFLLIQGAEQFILTPKILGKSVELHPVTLLVGVFVMAQMFGVFGALLAVPLTAIAKILGREFILPYFKTLAAEKPTGGK